MPLKVAQIIPAEEMGRFSLRPNQRVPRNAYVSLAALQTQFKDSAGSTRSSARNHRPTRLASPVADYGVRVEPSPQGYIDVTPIG